LIEKVKAFSTALQLFRVCRTTGINTRRAGCFRLSCSRSKKRRALGVFIFSTFSDIRIAHAIENDIQTGTRKRCRSMKRTPNSYEDRREGTKGRAKEAPPKEEGGKRSTTPGKKGQKKRKKKRKRGSPGRDRTPSVPRPSSRGSDFRRGFRAR